MRVVKSTSTEFHGWDLNSRNSCQRIQSGFKVDCYSYQATGNSSNTQKQFLLQQIPARIPWRWTYDLNIARKMFSAKKMFSINGITMGTIYQKRNQKEELFAHLFLAVYGETVFLQIFLSLGPYLQEKQNWTKLRRIIQPSLYVSPSKCVGVPETQVQILSK